MFTSLDFSDSNTRWMARIQLCVAVFSLLLVGATWPLWWPEGEYPAIPWFSGLLSVPASIDRALAWGMVLSAAGISVLSVRRCVGRADGEHVAGVPDSGRWLVIASTTWLVCLTFSVPLDQQRFQVWAWEFFWLTLFLSLASPRVALVCCRSLVIGIYVYSAISKFDAGFLETQGPWLWQGLRRAVGSEVAAWGTTSSLGMLVFPLGELMVAGLLGFPRTRFWGIAGSWVMHLTLLLTLGPWGRNQTPGVLLWNVFFLITVPILFLAKDSVTPSPGGKRGQSPARFHLRDRFCLAAVVGLSLWPALEGFGLCDHWPAWAVYSSRPEIVTLEVSEEEAHLLPQSLQPHLGSPLPLTHWRPISIDQWSFEQRGCPTYPQARYRLAVARSLETRYGVKLRVSEQSSPDRWSGQRHSTEIASLAPHNDQQFWLNTKSRKTMASIPMTFGDRMIAHTAQLSVACYAVALLLSARQGRGTKPSVAVAIFWTSGLVALVTHMVCAFHFLFHWSHAAALKHTALRTSEMTGWDWSGGLFINYAFLLFWAINVARVWREALGWSPVASLGWRRLVHGVFLFMMFNATVVFGPWHWTISSVLFSLAWWGMTKSQSTRPSEKF